MSMISGLIDELRKLAEYYDGSEVASIMRYAADTIWQLRDDLQRTNAENASLRELAEKTWKVAEKLCQAWDGPCHADGASIKPPCPLDERDELCVYGQLQRDLRELGVEVE